MDIDLLSKMVKELILDNDEVTLPGVGTFVAEIVPSTFSDKGYTINPPYRKLSFRQRQSEDTSLLEFYMSSNEVDKDSADRILSEFLSELKVVLQQKKLIIFPGLGRLRATKENNFFFIADEDLDIYPGGFGLEPISLKTHQETREEVDATLAGLKSIIQSPVEIVPEPVAPVTEVQEEEPAPVAEIEEPIIAAESVEEPIEEPAEESVEDSIEEETIAAPSEETMAFVAGLNGIPETPISVEPIEPEREVEEAVEEVVEETVEELSEEPKVEYEPEPVPEPEPEPTTEVVEEESAVSEETEVPAEEAVTDPVSTEETIEGPIGAPVVDLVEEPISAPAEETSVEPLEPAPDDTEEKEEEKSEDKHEFKVIDDITPEPVAPNSSAQGPDIKDLAKNISEPVPMPKPDPKPSKGAKVIVKILKVLLVLVIIAAIALLAFVLLAHVAPDFVDSILYTPEELRIINY
ncbi:MAG: hypothetical protein MJZ16_06700 [Bacteroidales bacterium]|nr:hypothetical protein [Bacteroidales bacterium]